MGILDELMAQFAPQPAQEDPRIAAIQSYMQRDLARRMYGGETLQGKDATDLLNLSNPPEYKNMPEHEDDIFGY